MLHVENRSEASVDEDPFSSLYHLVLNQEGIEGEPDVNLVLCSSEEIRTLNRRYRGLDRPTDVLSFTADEPSLHLLGDILIDTVTAESQKGSHSLKEELQVLFLHGLLHLLGYDHHRPEDKTAMREREQRYWLMFGQEGDFS